MESARDHTDTHSYTHSHSYAYIHFHAQNDTDTESRAHAKAAPDPAASCEAALVKGAIIGIRAPACLVHRHRRLLQAGD